MSRSQLRIMRPNEPLRVALVRFLRSKGFSHIPAACQPAKIFQNGFWPRTGPVSAFNRTRGEGIAAIQSEVLSAASPLKKVTKCSQRLKTVADDLSNR